MNLNSDVLKIIIYFMDTTTSILFSRTCRKLRPLTKNWNLLRAACIEGYLLVIKSLYKDGVMLDYRTYVAAAYRGHLHIIKWLWSKRIYHKKYMRQVSYPRDGEFRRDNNDNKISPFILTAAKNNHQSILNWICHCTDIASEVYEHNVVAAAAAKNNVEIVKWLYPLTIITRVDYIIHEVILNDNLELLKFVCKNSSSNYDYYTNTAYNQLMIFQRIGVEFTCSDVILLWKFNDDDCEKIRKFKNGMTSSVWHFAAEHSKQYPCLDFVETLNIPFPPVIFMKTLDDNVLRWFQNRVVPVQAVQ